MSLRTLAANHLLRVHRCAENGAQHTACLLIQYRHRHLALLDQLLERIGQVVLLIAKLALLRLTVCESAHLDVQTTCSSLQGVGRATPVADEGTIPVPFLLQDAIQQFVVVAAVYPLPLVVRAHDGIDMCFIHSLLERTQIDFTQGTLRHIHIHPKAVCLLVVQHEMLQTASHTIGLCSLDVGHHDFSCQVGVFTRIFKRTSIQGGALDVHARTQHDVLASESKLLTHCITIGSREVAVPRGSQTGQRWERHHIVIGPFGRIPSVPLQFLTHTMRTVIHIQLTDAQSGYACTGELALRMQDLYLLMRCHTTQCILHTLFQWSIGVQIGLCLYCHCCRCQQDCQDSCFLHKVGISN